MKVEMNVYHYIKVEEDDQEIAEGLITSLNIEIYKIEDGVWCTESKEDASEVALYLYKHEIPIESVALEGNIEDDLGISKN